MTLLQDETEAAALTLPKLREYQPDPVPGRTSVAFNVRESDEKNRSAFEGMVDQTYIPYRDDPWIAALLAVNLAPLDADDSFTIEVTLSAGARLVEVAVDRTERNGGTLVVFQTGPYKHIWAMSSAAKENAEGENDYTQFFVERMREWKPQVLVVASVSRLVRSVAEGGLVTNALSKVVDQLWVGGYRLMELVGQGSSYGVQALSNEANHAAGERDSIVSRTTLGRVGRARGGRWPHGNSSVPFGYELEPRTRILIPVPDVRDRVREMLLVLGDDSAPSVIVDRLRLLEIPSFRPSNKDLLAELTTARTNARALVDSLLVWAPLWIHGEHLFRFACPYRGLKELNGAPVVRDASDPRDKGEMQLLLVPGTPEGGWAEPAVLHRLAQMAKHRTAALLDGGILAPERPLHPSIEERSADPELLKAVQRTSRRSTRLPASVPRKRGTPNIAPFSGFSWQDENGVYEIKVAKHEYKVERRAWADGARPATRDPR